MMPSRVTNVLVIIFLIAISILLVNIIYLNHAARKDCCLGKKTTVRQAGSTYLKSNCSGYGRRSPNFDDLPGLPPGKSSKFGDLPIMAE
jgi:hypothetical protein